MGLGAVTAIVDSLVEIVRNQASIHLCFDVALQFIELLVTAGAKDAEVCRCHFLEITSWRFVVFNLQARIKVPVNAKISKIDLIAVSARINPGILLKAYIAIFRREEMVSMTTENFLKIREFLK